MIRKKIVLLSKLSISFVPKFSHKFGCILIFTNDQRILLVMQSYDVPLAFPLYHM